MTTAPPAAVQIAVDVVDRTHEGSPYIALDTCNELARRGWLHDPAELVALRARVASVEEFCRWLIAMDDPDSPEGMEARRTVTLSRIIDRARVTLGET